MRLVRITVALVLTGCVSAVPSLAPRTCSSDATFVDDCGSLLAGTTPVAVCIVCQMPASGCLVAGFYCVRSNWGCADPQCEGAHGAD